MMIVYEGLEAIVSPLSFTTVAIGSFDGIHIGHQAIISTAVQDARAHNRLAVVLTFDRHPATLFNPGSAPLIITPLKQRIELISHLGADVLIVLKFDEELAELNHEKFLTKILKSMVGAVSIVEGEDFCFGKNRQGDVKYLDSVQKRYGFTLHALQPVMSGDTPASSTQVRESLASGDTAQAEEMLGHPFWLEGTVEHGLQLGRELGFPTANMRISNGQIVPGDGVYAVWGKLADDRVVRGACSIGDRATVAGAGRAIEVYMLEYDGNLYDQPLILQFVKKIRNQIQFNNLKDLSEQIKIDVDQIQSLLFNTEPTFYQAAE